MSRQCVLVLVVQAEVALDLLAEAALDHPAEAEVQVVSGHQEEVGLDLQEGVDREADLAHRMDREDAVQVVFSPPEVLTHLHHYWMHSI
jgi:hypothetical protein